MMGGWGTLRGALTVPKSQAAQNLITLQGRSHPINMKLWANYWYIDNKIDATMRGGQSSPRAKERGTHRAGRSAQVACRLPSSKSRTEKLMSQPRPRHPPQSHAWGHCRVGSVVSRVFLRFQPPCLLSYQYTERQTTLFFIVKILVYFLITYLSS